MKSQKWLMGCFFIITSMFLVISFMVYRVDPYFHYHAPRANQYYYEINNQRSQNDGIIKHFDYEALITGTSMTNGFKTSEAEKYFGYSFIKVPFNGASYKEINSNVVNAIKSNPNLKLVIRALDMNMFGQDKDTMRFDLGVYPKHLYNSNPLDDIKYLLNREIAFGLSYDMLVGRRKEGFKPGITSFDEYSRFTDKNIGINSVIQDKNVLLAQTGDEESLTDEEKAILIANIKQNLIEAADTNPEIDFFYFFTPYSIAFWNTMRVEGTLKKQIEMERIVTELLLPYENIHLFSFNLRTDITTDLNNYTDSLHYEGWINSLMLKYMSIDMYRITYDNYLNYFDDELDYYDNFDYTSLCGQIDYNDDLFAAALLNNELTGAEVYNLPENENPIDHIEIELDDEYNYLVFNVKDDLIICIYDKNNELVDKQEISSPNNNGYNRHTIDISEISGPILIESTNSLFDVAFY